MSRTSTHIVLGLGLGAVGSFALNIGFLPDYRIIIAYLHLCQHGIGYQQIKLPAFLPQLVRKVLTCSSDRV